MGLAEATTKKTTRSVLVEEGFRSSSFEAVRRATTAKALQWGWGVPGAQAQPGKNPYLSLIPHFASSGPTMGSMVVTTAIVAPRI